VAALEMNANILTADRTAKRHTVFSRLGIATTFLTANNAQYNIKNTKKTQQFLLKTCRASINIP
jgi:hypothetical protein